MNVVLPDVREADQRDVGHELSSSRSHCSSPRSPCSANDGARRRVGEEPGVAASASAACRGEPAIAVVDEVGEQRAAVHRSHRGALGHRDDRCRAPACRGFPCPCRGCRRSPAGGVVAEREQRRHVVVGDQPHVATRAAVAAVGTAPGHVRLTPERDAAGAAVATAHVERALVDEPGHGGSA